MPKTPRNYLAEYDAANEAEKYPLVQKWIREEPLAFFKQLREERPVLKTPECTLVALFTDVRDMLQMPKVFTVDLYKPKMGVTGPNDAIAWRPPAMLTARPCCWLAWTIAWSSDSLRGCSMRCTWVRFRPECTSFTHSPGPEPDHPKDRRRSSNALVASRLTRMPTSNSASA